MLVKCPECELQVSDKALTCPHCGFPMKSSVKPKQTHKYNKHRRLPNGFGQISEIKGRYLRNPYRAMISVGKNDTGHIISKTLGYYPTYNDAYTALTEYNKRPYDLDNRMTVEELYMKWSEQYFKTLKSASSVRTITSAWNYCSSIKSISIKSLRVRHIKACMDTAPSTNMQARIKSMFNIMLDYAVEMELIDQNYARNFASEKVVNKSHIVFTDEEMNTFWAHTDIQYVKMILIQCYTGFRPQELCLIKNENIDLNRNIIIGGMKTEAGTDRVVPIHHLILDFVKEKYNANNTYLFEDITYDVYRRRFNEVIKLLNLNPEHKPHDPRKQFITMAKKYNVDEYAIKRIVGHTINDITEKVYTERSIDWLKEEVNKIKM